MENTEPKPSAERKEPEGREQEALDLLVKALERLEHWEEAVDNLRVSPGTSLASDDRATAYETLSSQVRSHLGGAIDHMRALRELAITAQSMPAMAGFTLLRAAIEGIGTTLWLLGPASRDERVVRSLQLAAEGHRDVLVAAAELRGEVYKDGEDKDTRRLKELKGLRPGLSERSLKAPVLTERMRRAQKYAGDQSFTILSMWRIASGIAHGRRALLYEILEREVIAEDDLGFEVKMTSSYSAIAGFYVLTEHYLDRAVRLFRARNGEPLALAYTPSGSTGQVWQ